MECAYARDLDYIVTRDIKGFASSKIPVVLPMDFLEVWKNHQ